jgi:hypothetical protein
MITRIFLSQTHSHLSIGSTNASRLASTVAVLKIEIMTGKGKSIE